MNLSEFFVRDFREAAPYINYLRGKTLVIGIAGSLLEGATLRTLAADLNLLASLGVRLVVVHGSRSQISALAEARGHTPQYHNGRRITDETTLTHAKQACGMLRCDIEAALSIGMTTATQRSRALAIAAGNFVSARPLGVIDGIDMGYTGRVRKIDTESIRQRLDSGALVLISPLGHSLSGKTFNLSMGDIAEAAAIALAAEKLIYVVEQEGILNEHGTLISNLSAQEARELLDNQRAQPNQRRLLQSAVNAVEKQVQRTQILSGRQDGSLIRELFTRHGAGTSVARAAFMTIRQAQSSDISAITTLIRPLEDEGVLLRRSREYLENHIGEFSILEHDRQIYGCVALKTFEPSEAGELACLVVSPEAQDGGYGELLLEHLLANARARGIRRLFALSTHTGEWFIERGFQAAAVADLPEERQQEYHQSRRQSKVFVYSL
ncbi:amino-acid N-acetyltransferase [Uruburuella suis]|jgi:amino-acid N-acetyltransferase|uniref:amino-acid N-acetyltransferase n=1 Tax=Uruburuella suis TaxID=252130 RepID=UPI0024929A0B|nr:amino-acid N-acetyltransferase [Uruburuella suis]HRL34280.1 amino-acid N-acetyltransferase [Neisseria sp.]